MEIHVLASGSTGNAYTISDGASSLLLDAGISMKALQIGTRFKLSSLSGALITHEHKDHSRAVRDLARFGVDVYASLGTLEACGVTGRRLHPVRAREEFAAGTFKVLPFDVEHDAREPLGFLCASTATGEKLLYFTDTYFVRYRFRGLTHIMAECNHTERGLWNSVAEGRVSPELAARLVKSHMSLEHLLEMLQANDLSRVQQIYLLHLSDNNSEEQRMKEAVQRLTGVEVYVC
ncbi:MAG: MBL fold metallo-hydrolase [Oscillibacter sp.]|nr:MBL fold metallo-hydrolase [Oscillibacter sp.]